MRCRTQSCALNWRWRPQQGDCPNGTVHGQSMAEFHAWKAAWHVSFSKMGKRKANGRWCKPVHVEWTVMAKRMCAADVRVVSILEKRKRRGERLLFFV